MERPSNGIPHIQSIPLTSKLLQCPSLKEIESNVNEITKYVLENLNRSDFDWKEVYRNIGELNSDQMRSIQVYMETVLSMPDFEGMPFAKKAGIMVMAIYLLRYGNDWEIESNSIDTLCFSVSLIIEIFEDFVINIETEVSANKLPNGSFSFPISMWREMVKSYLRFEDSLKAHPVWTYTVNACKADTGYLIGGGDEEMYKMITSDYSLSRLMRNWLKELDCTQLTVQCIIKYKLMPKHNGNIFAMLREMATCYLMRGDGGTDPTVQCEWDNVISISNRYSIDEQQSFGISAHDDHCCIHCWWMGIVSDPHIITAENIGVFWKFVAQCCPQNVFPVQNGSESQCARYDVDVVRCSFITLFRKYHHWCNRMEERMLHHILESLHRLSLLQPLSDIVEMIGIRHWTKIDKNICCRIFSPLHIAEMEEKHRFLFHRVRDYWSEHQTLSARIFEDGYTRFGAKRWSMCLVMLQKDNVLDLSMIIPLILQRQNRVLLELCSPCIFNTDRMDQILEIVDNALRCDVHKTLDSVTDAIKSVRNGEQMMKWKVDVYAVLVSHRLDKMSKREGAPQQEAVFEIWNYLIGSGIGRMDRVQCLDRRSQNNYLMICALRWMCFSEFRPTTFRRKQSHFSLTKNP